MKRSEIYRKAAQLLDARRASLLDGCCSAIRASGGDELRHTADFEDMFAPEGVRGGYWGLNWADNFPRGWLTLISREAKPCRVLALCFMAAIAEWEEKHGA